MEEKFIKNCLKLKALNNYERFVLLCMIDGISARAARKYVGGSYLKFYKTRELLKDFIEYRVILLRNRKLIDNFLRNCLTKHQYDIFRKLMLFPIRRTGYYAKIFGYKVNNFGSCDALSRLVERCIERMAKSINKNITDTHYIYKRFLELFIKIAFDGRFRNKWRKYLNDKW
jgi:hypothetical protein